MATNQNVTNDKSKKVAKKFACKECEKIGKEKNYTQTHNLKLHIQKVHGTAVWLNNCFQMLFARMPFNKYFQCKINFISFCFHLTLS